MTSLDVTCSNGTNLETSKGCVAGFAFQSLTMGLKAFFATYQEMKYSLHLFEKKHPDEQKDFNTPLSFFELSAETILHFHHFTELILKDLLRSEHVLLADEGSKKPVVLKKLLTGKPLTADEKSGIRSIEFSEALDRIVDLINADEITDAATLEFINDSKDVLKKLNTLRNRIWHRGTFVLRYDALDEFICQYFLPVLNRVLSLAHYSGQERLWKYRDLECGFDPLGFLESERDSYSIGKFALAKELGRAAYCNPIMRDNAWARLFNGEISRRAVAAANSEGHNVSNVTTCPVCGIRSLVVYDDVEVEGEDLETGTYDRAWRYTWQVKCHCCSLEINHHLDNGSAYGIPIADYWETEEM
jgi:hypothetical protein